MKFMSSFQCLIGGNPVQFQDPSSTIKPSPHVPSSSSQLMLLDEHDNDDDDDDQIKDGNSNDHQVITNNKKIKKMKKLKKKKKKQKDAKVIKVFKADGEIKVYQKPIKVSEVMTDEYMVCRSDSFYIGQKIPPLSQHDRLQPGNTYFLLPSHLFHSVLSFVTIASITASSSSSSIQQQQQQQLKQDHMTDVDSSSSNANQMKMKAAFLKKAAASSCSPFDIQKTPSGTLRIRVSEMFISQLMMDQAAAAAVASEDGDLIDHLLLCTTPQLHREYKQLVVGARRGWKPKLEMIKESPPKGKRKVKMLLSASISRMKKKMKNNKSAPSVSQTTTTISSSSASASASSTSSSSQKKKKKKANKQTNVVSKTK